VITNKFISILSIFVIATLVSTTASVMKVQSVMAIAIPTCTQCAKEFAPGQEKNTAESNFDPGAKAFAPGQEAKFPSSTCSSYNGKEFTPGQEKKDIGTIGQ
jgi:hypothetical protein